MTRPHVGSVSPSTRPSLGDSIPIRNVASVAALRQGVLALARRPKKSVNRRLKMSGAFDSDCGGRPSHAADVGRVGGLGHAAQDDLVYFSRRHLDPLEQRHQRLPAQFLGVHAAGRRARLDEGGANAVENDHFLHGASVRPK